MDVAGKVAVVTGVSKGIGLSTVQQLLEAGATVAGWGRTAPEFEHDRFHFFPTDVRQAEQVAASYEATTKALGDEIAILINNAGLGYQGMLHQMDPAQWQEMYDTNVHGVFFCSRLIIPGMMAREEGHIVNISSIAGTTGIETMAGYCGTKHAVRGISHSLYKELRRYGIKVTAIYPGSVNTGFFDNIDSVTANEHMMSPDDIGSTIMHVLQSSGNYHHVDIEVRPLKPKG